MRTINAAALAEINREFGLEPINIVRVYWNNTFTDYSDKAEGLEDFNVQGKVLEISGLDNVVSLDRSTSSASITIKLDDSDGSLRTIINNSDIHKRPVKILQWFEGRPKSDAFVLFAGEINTPIEWSEGERTLTFSVVNTVENLEFGFSLEEGIFQKIPVAAYGEPFPVVFGSVYKVPALLLGESPSGILGEGFAWVFEEQYESEILDLTAKMNEAYDIAQDLYQQHIALEILAASYNDGDIGVTGNPDDYDTYLQYHGMSQQAFQQSQEYSDEYLSLQAEVQALQEDFEEKKAYAKRGVLIASQNFPRNLPVTIEINQSRFSAVFNGVSMSIGGLIERPDEAPKEFYFAKLEETTTHKTYNTESSKEKFRWFDAGSKIRVISVPLYYAACLGSNSQIRGVYARREGVRILVPQNMYIVRRVPFTSSLGQTVYATIIQMNQPLTTLYDHKGEQLYESDDIWCDIVGEVAGRLIPILLWTISNFTDLTIDGPSFTAVNNYTIHNPMNFAVLDRKNVLDFIKEICLQARTAVWVDDGKVKLRYLPVAPTATVTITPDDVLENSLVVTCDDTEQLKTKITALWRPSLDQEDPNKIIIRTNVKKYGLQEEEIDYYGFQNAQLVQRSAAYWSIRWGNTWKRLKLTTHVGKLQLEAQDPVGLVGFNGMFSEGNITGIVESCVFDSTNLSVELEIWLPIRWGEMSRYRFAYPANVTQLYGIGSPEFQTGNPFEDVRDTTGILSQPTFVSFNAPPYPSGGYRIDDTPPDLTFDTALLDVPLLYGRPSGIEDANARKDYELKQPEPFVTEEDSGSVDIGTVTEQSEDDNITYKVTTVDNKERTVKQMRIASGWKIVLGTPVVIVKKKGTWYMQAPTWAREEEE